MGLGDGGRAVKEINDQKESIFSGGEIKSGMLEEFKEILKVNVCFIQI